MRTGGLLAHGTALCKLPSLLRMGVRTPSWRRACGRDNQRSLRELAWERCPPTLGLGEEVTQEPILSFLLACSTLPRSPGLQSPSLTLEGGFRWPETAGLLILSHKDNPNTLPHTGPTSPQSYSQNCARCCRRGGAQAIHLGRRPPWALSFPLPTPVSPLERDGLTASLLPLDSG